MLSKSLLALVLALVLLLMPAFCALGNSAEPPCITILVSGAPETLTISFTPMDGDNVQPFSVAKMAWERYYRLYYHEFDQRQLTGALLTATDGQNTWRFTLSKDQLTGMYNNLFTLNLKTGTLTSGQPPYRVPLLVALRLSLTLAVEYTVLLLFGYRQKKSRSIFLWINLVTQGFVNLLLTGPLLGAYWIIVYVLTELLVFIAEIIAYILLLREKSRLRATAYALCANTASLFFGIVLLSYLPA